MAFANGRGEAFAALADVVGAGAGREAALRLGRQWALADLAGYVAHPEERETARQLLAAEGRAPKVPRALRTLTVLQGLALRGRSATTVLTAIRLGLLGR